MIRHAWIHIITQVQNLNPDIVGFSEVWANSSKHRLIDGLKSQFPYSAWDHNDNSLQIGSGLLLLSRFPLSNVLFNQYVNLSGFDRISQKGFILATAKIGEQEILIAHTHTQADENNDAINNRKANLNQLFNIFCSQADSMPIILLGDLNIVGEDNSGNPTQEYTYLRLLFRNNYMSDSYRSVNTSAKSDPGYTYDAVNNKLINRFDHTSAVNAIKQRLDYMFVRGLQPNSVTVLKTFTFQISDGTIDLSDHYPLYGSFNLPQT